MTHVHTHRVNALCKVLRISRSGYYARRHRPESARSRENQRLLVSIRASFEGSRKTYGAIRVCRDLRDEGYGCGKNRVARLMRKNGLKSVHRFKYRPQTTDSGHGLALAPNVICQDFTAKVPNQKWGCDITYIPTDEGFLYVAIVLDFYSRKIVGWFAGPSLAASLCCDALHMAFVLRQPPKELIHHSDRGVQYASDQYRGLLQSHGLTQSMSRKGNCYDNAMVESFFHTMKVERSNRNRYRTRDEAIADIQDYIDRFYNNQRRHSALDYMCPTQYERSHPVAA